MIDLREVFRAGRVMRWHANPDMSHVSDPIDGHAGRVARLLIALHPDPPVSLIVEALTHDDGEMGVGDLAAPAKAADPELARKLDILEIAQRVRIWGAVPKLDVEGVKWIRLCDRLDAYMVMRAHRPDLAATTAWQRDWRVIQGLARDLGVEPEVCGAIA